MTMHEGPRNFEQDSTRRVTFGEFVIGEHTIEDIAGIDGAVLDEMSQVFDVRPDGDWTVDGLGELISIVGPAKRLQDNLPEITQLLPGEDGKQIAIKWAKTSGLLEPVFRKFENPNEQLSDRFETAVITGGVRNWMMRRATLLVEISQQKELSEVLLVAGTREMKTSEGPDVVEGDTEATFMERVIQPMLEDAGLLVRIKTPDTASGNEIAIHVAAEVGEGNVLVACNAGNWIQNGGQIRRAIGEDRVFVVSDGFPVAENNEPPAIAQNPFTAVGIIARNLQELKRHEK